MKHLDMETAGFYFDSVKKGVWNFYDRMMKNNSVEILITLEMIEAMAEEFMKHGSGKDVQVIIDLLLDHINQVITKFEN